MLLFTHAHSYKLTAAAHEMKKLFLHKKMIAITVKPLMPNSMRSDSRVSFQYHKAILYLLWMNAKIRKTVFHHWTTMTVDHKQQRHQKTKLLWSWVFQIMTSVVENYCHHHHQKSPKKIQLMKKLHDHRVVINFHQSITPFPIHTVCYTTLFNLLLFAKSAKFPHFQNYWLVTRRYTLKPERQTTMTWWPFATIRNGQKNSTLFLLDCPGVPQCLV